AAKAFQAATQGEPGARCTERSTAAAPRRSEAPAAPPLQRPARAANPAPNPAPGQSAQPTLSGLDPAEQAGAASADEDMLDIPAFLRRQAN
ncbi:MAG TPA: cell division protein FtsZ, partial [Kiloniellales bacterium]|nr:cell division protein FtsZ [Kiloniellales bacterium]